MPQWSTLRFFIHLPPCTPRGIEMGRGGQRRKNAAESDVRRMYLRGRKGTLKVDALPLEQALAHSKISPKSRPVKVKPLGSYSGIVAVDASVAIESSPSRNREKAPWAVGRTQSGSVLRRKSQLRRSSRATPPARVPMPQNSTAREAITENQRRQERPVPKLPRPKRISPERKYDGQPRFEGGFRFVQGGLPELGRR